MNCTAELRHVQQETCHNYNNFSESENTRPNVRGKVRIKRYKSSLSSHYRDRSPELEITSLDETKVKEVFKFLPYEETGVLLGWKERNEKFSKNIVSGNACERIPSFFKKFEKFKKKRSFCKPTEIFETQEAIFGEIERVRKGKSAGRKKLLKQIGWKSLQMQGPLNVKWCKEESRCLHLKRKSTGEEWFQRYKCRSWRHLGECSKWKGKQDFVRIKRAIEKLGNNWVYVVLTFDREKDLYDAYRGIVFAWDKLRKRLMREYGPIQYITLIEQHKDGYPHINILIHNEKLFEACNAEYEVTPLKECFRENSLPETGPAAIYGWRWEKVRWWDNAVTGSGFGPIFWLEPMRSSEAISAYFVKLTGEMAGQMSSELIKNESQSQNPVVAPKHFRRLRASQGLLDPIEKDEDLTGELLNISIEEAVKEGLEDGIIEEADIEPEYEKKLEKSLSRRPQYQDWLEGLQERYSIQSEELDLSEEEIPF